MMNGGSDVISLSKDKRTQRLCHELFGDDQDSAGPLVAYLLRVAGPAPRPIC